jgi:hypothetical protein
MCVQKWQGYLNIVVKISASEAVAIVYLQFLLFGIFVILLEF